MSKKVKGHNDECKLLEKIFTIKKCQHKGIHNMPCIYKESITNENRTTVSKAICPEYQKVIDHNKFLEFENSRLTKVYQKAVNKTHEVNAHNAKLVEALEKVKDMQENRQKLFNHMSTEHGLTLLESEMNSIYSICIGHEEYVKYLNWLHSKPVDTKTVDAIDPTFWRRLEMFVSNIQVNDMAGEEEKQYIIHVIESKK
jgi:hypothetical protein